MRFPSGRVLRNEGAAYCRREERRMFASPGKMLIAVGLIVLGLGLLVEFAPWLRLGRLPGDIAVGSGNVRFYFPIATSILISIVLTVLFSLFARR
jgi:hypothetical protein